MPEYPLYPLNPLIPEYPLTIVAELWNVPSANCIPPRRVAVLLMRIFPAMNKLPPYIETAFPPVTVEVPMPTFPVLATIKLPPTPTPPATTNAPVVDDVDALLENTVKLLIQPAVATYRLPPIPAPPNTCNAPLVLDVVALLLVIITVSVVVRNKLLM